MRSPGARRSRWSADGSARPRGDHRRPRRGRQDDGGAAARRAARLRADPDGRHVPRARAQRAARRDLARRHGRAGAAPGAARRHHRARPREAERRGRDARDPQPGGGRRDLDPLDAPRGPRQGDAAAAARRRARRCLARGPGHGHHRVPARRRHAELAEQGVSADLDTIRDEVKVRDRQDTTRVLAPLVKAADAIEIDTSDLSIDEVVDRMAATVAARRAAAPRSAFYSVCRGVALAIMRALWRVEGRGMQHVPPSGPVLLIANHSSVLDPPFVGGVAPRQLTFLAKAELFAVPGFGRLIHALNARPVRREGADATALRVALRALERNGALLVFPEGTRGEEGTLRAPKPGAALLAVLSGAPVVPVYVRGSGRAWPRGRRLPRPAKVVVTFGPPLRFERPAGAGKKEYYDSVSRDMMAAIARLQNH